MSFGYSVGDIVLLSQLAWKAYKSCKQAPDSFAGVSQETLSLHAVLRELEETLRESSLSEAQQKRLQIVCEGPEAILKELLALVEKYESLATSSQRAWDRMKYAAEDIAGLRTRLISSTVLLTTFIASTQFAVEQKLRKLLKEVQSGKRESSIFSVQTIDSLSIDDRIAWRDVRKALEDIGITPMAFQQNKDFILSFLRDAMLRDEFQELRPAEQSISAVLAAQIDLFSSTDQGSQGIPPSPIGLDNIMAANVTSKTNPSESSKFFSKVGIKIPLSDEFNQLRLRPGDWLRRIRGVTGNENFAKRSSWESSQPNSATQVSRDIDKYLSRESRELDHKKKLLMLGPGEAGKSTIVAQLKILYGGGFTLEEYKYWKRLLWANTVVGFRIAIEEMKDRESSIEFRDQELAMESIEALRLTKDIWERDEIPPGMLNHLSVLWNEPIFSKYIELGNEYAQLYNLKYCYHNIGSLASLGSFPSHDMILHAGFRTLETVPTTFQIEDTDTELHVIDVGGVRSARKKWVESIEGASALIYVVSITGYDRCLVEDRTGNQMLDSLMLFESVLSVPWFRDCATILFFTKLDLLPEYLKSHPLSLNTKFLDYVPSDNGLDEGSNVLQFFMRKFLSLNPDSRHIEVHAGDITNTTAIQPCLRRILENQKLQARDSKAKGARTEVRNNREACCAASRLIKEGVVSG